MTTTSVSCATRGRVNAVAVTEDLSSLIAANCRRFAYDYSIGDEVLKLVYQPIELAPRATGPFRIEQLHTNGMLTI